MATNVKSYTDKQLLDRVKSLNTFKGIPSGYWILGIRSKADAYDIMDDKFYVFQGEKFISVLTGTTNAGAYGILNFAKWDKRGVAFIKADEWYYDVWSMGRHNGSSGQSVIALRQTGGFKVYRDNNKNKISGDVKDFSVEYNKGLNFHPRTYDLKTTVLNWTIGAWSTGCQVINNIPKYKVIMDKFIASQQKLYTYCLIDEF